MTWMKGMVTAALASALVVGCSDRNENRTANAGDRAAATADRAGDRTERAAGSTSESVREGAARTENSMERGAERTGEALERGGEKVADAAREVGGKVKRVTNDLLETDDGEIRIGNDTEFYRDGQRIERDEIRPGDEVRASFDSAGDKIEAKRIEVQRKAD
jgi:hypothetical protein